MHTRTLIDRLFEAPARPLWYFWELDPSSQDKLSALATLPQVESHHVTAAYNPSPEEATPLDALLGETRRIHAFRLASNGRAEAVEVDTPNLSSNKHPHVTVSLAPGVPAKTSNDMLEEVPEEDSEPVDIWLTGTLKKEGGA